MVFVKMQDKSELWTETNGGVYVNGPVKLLYYRIADCQS